MKLKSCIKVWILMLAMGGGLPAFAMGKACYDLPKQDLSKEEIYERLVAYYGEDMKPSQTRKFSPKKSHEKGGQIAVRTYIYEIEVRNDQEKGELYYLDKGTLDDLVQELAKYTGLNLVADYGDYQDNEFYLLSIFADKPFFVKGLYSKEIKDVFVKEGLVEYYDDIVKSIDDLKPIKGKRTLIYNAGLKVYDNIERHNLYSIYVHDSGLYSTIKQAFYAEYFSLLSGAQSGFDEKYPSILNYDNQKLEYSTFDKYLLCVKHSDDIPMRLDSDTYLKLLVQQIFKLQK